MSALFAKVPTMYRPQLFVCERSAVLSRIRNILRITVCFRICPRYLNVTYGRTDELR